MVDRMTKAELMKEFDELEKEKGVRIEGIYWNSKKSTILQRGKNRKHSQSICFRSAPRCRFGKK